MGSWPTLEIAKLVVGVLTPMSVALLGWLFSRQLKRLDLSNWTNQKLIEKRLAIYDDIAPKLNQLLCFFTWVGYWKTISPADAIHAKRDLDKTLNIYRHVFEVDVYDTYQAYIHILFETYTSAGHDAKLRALVRSPDGDRRTDSGYAWSEAWDSHQQQHQPAAATSAACRPQKSRPGITSSRPASQPTKVLPRNRCR
jgi:hypothetical protein